MTRVTGRDHVGDEYYAPHLYGDSRKYNNNPSGNRTAILQRMYMRVLTELAVNRFRWTGLPKEVDVRFMELTLFYRGLSVFFHDAEYGKFMALQGTPAGRTDMLQNPTAFQVTGASYAGKRLRAVNGVELVDGEFVGTEAECVPVWSNYMRVPDLDIVLIYASKFAELDQTIELNIKAARRTRVAVVDENTNLSMTNIIRQIDEGQPLIKVGRSLSDSVEAIDLGVNPDSIEKLHILKGRLWNECMTLLGIHNANQDKKERLVVDEVSANDDQVDSTRAVNLNARRQAAERMNERYGLMVEVSYHTDPDNVTSDMYDELDITEEGGDNGNIHTGAETSN